MWVADSLHRMNALAGLAMAFAPKGLGHYWKTHYQDKTFEHLYRLTAFDSRC